MPILVRYAPPSLTREQYDKVNESMRENGPEGPPPALQLHVLFGDEPQLLVSEMWGVRGCLADAWEGMIKPALSKAGVQVPEPQRLTVHEAWGSSVNA